MLNNLATASLIHAEIARRVINGFVLAGKPNTHPCKRPTIYTREGWGGPYVPPSVLPDHIKRATARVGLII